MEKDKKTIRHSIKGALVKGFLEKKDRKGFEALTGADGKWIQARTKGPGHGSISRAFYA